MERVSKAIGDPISGVVQVKSCLVLAKLLGLIHRLCNSG